LKLVAYSLAVVLGGLGVVFVAGHQGLWPRILVGSILLVAAVALVVAVRLRPSVVERTVVQKIELSGDVSVQDLRCNECGGRLTEESVTVRAGAVFVACGHCGASYQLEEAPKW
jgi:Zn finger protein HypA/HybF involved in hydrogenase expression